MRRRPLAVVLAALIAAAAIAWAILAQGAKAAGSSPPAPFVPSFAVLAQRPSATAAKAPHVALRPAPAKARRLRMLMDHLPAPPRGELRVAASIAPRPTTTAAPTTTAVVLSDATSTDTADWACLRFYESDDNYQAVGSAYGAYQFELSTWYMLGYSGYPNEAPPWEQDQAALKLYAWDVATWGPGEGFHAWSTASLCGLA